MFEITDETRNAAIAEMKSILIETFDKDILDKDDELLTRTVGESFDKAVEIVKRQFGM